ncbi:MAG: hypothetical protein K1060chlam2_01395 [Chlamydiae bacterium]|nr:hypothetical protein [Chlamydiota bacterium]
MSTHNHYLLRHAHRPQFQPGEWGHDISITSEGKEAAQEVGRLFSNSQVKTIWTSPIKRCIQTARELREGINLNIPIRHSHLLGDPGFMILNPRVAGQLFRKYNLIEVIELILRGIPVPGFYPLEVGCKKMLKNLLKDKRSSSIWVTHDITICLLASWIFNQKHPEEMMPGFLEGIEFSFSKNGIFAYFKGLKARIDETSLRGVLDSKTKPAFLKSSMNSSNVLS